MGTVFVKKTYEAFQLSINNVSPLISDKFALKAFNYLAYNREVSSPLVAIQLLRLPNHYTLCDNFKSINLGFF